MQRCFAAFSMLLLVLCFAGCSAEKKDAVTGADQTEIDAYLATEAAEQAALEGQMKDAAKTTK